METNKDIIRPAAAIGAVVVALYDFVSIEITEELSFNRGDRIIITAKAGEGWAQGKLQHSPSTIGYFPLSLVADEDDDEAREAVITDADVDALSRASEHLACRSCACELFHAQLWNPLKCSHCFHAFAVHNVNNEASSTPPSPAKRAAAAAAFDSDDAHIRHTLAASREQLDAALNAELKRNPTLSATTAHIPDVQLADTKRFSPMLLYRVLSCVGLDDATVEEICQLLQVKVAHLPVLLRTSRVKNLKALATQTEEFLEDQRLLDGIVRAQAAVRGRRVRARFAHLSIEDRGHVLSIVKQFRDLFASEKRYINDLLVVVEDYLLPLRRAAAQPKSKLLPSQTLATIFSSIEVILDTHQSLYRDLVRIRDDVQWPLLGNIGDALLKAAPDFACYRLYVEGFKDAMSTLDSELARNDKLRAFCDATYERCSTQKGTWVDLGGLLSSPLNRITKYESVLQSLNTLPLERILAQSDAESTVNAYTIVNQQSEIVRKHLQETEHTAKIKALKRELSGVEGPFELQKEGRRLVRDGVLVSATSKKRRRVILFTDICIVATPKGKQFRVKYMHDWIECEVRAITSPADYAAAAAAGGGAALGGSKGSVGSGGGSGGGGMSSAQDQAYAAAMSMHMNANSGANSGSTLASSGGGNGGNAATANASGFVLEIAPATGEKYSFLCDSAGERDKWLNAMRDLISAKNADRLFGVSLENLFRTQAEADEAAEGAADNDVDNSVPELAFLPRGLHIVARELLKHRDVDGIFRESGSKDQVQSLIKTLDAGADVSFEKINPHTIAGVFKQWFRQLPEPLFPFSAYDRLIFLQNYVVAKGKQNSVNHKAAMREIIGEWPIEHRRVLRFFVPFLNRFVEADNRMSAQNVAIVFAPITCYPREITFSSTLETPGVISTVKFLLEHPELIEEQEQ